MREGSAAALPFQGRWLERIAWYALLAVPAGVPVAISKMPFTSLPPITSTLVVYPKLFVLSWLVGVSLLAWVSGVLIGEIKIRAVPLGWPLVTFFGLACLSTALGLSPMTAFFGGDYYAVGLLVLLLGGALYLLLTQLVTNVDRMNAFSWAMVAGGVVVAIVGLLQMAGVDPLGATSLPGFMNARGTSLLGNPDFTGNYLVVPAVIAATLTLSEARATRRAVAGCAFVLTSSALLGTLTRGAGLGFAVGVVVLGVAFARVPSKIGRWQHLALGAAVTLAIPALIVLRNPVRLTRQILDLSGGATAGSGRLILWREAVAIASRHALLGTGPDSYRLGWYAVRDAASVRLSGLSTLSQDPHNVALLLAATVGVPAALVAFGFVVASLATTRTAAFSRDESGSGRLLYAGWWASLLGLCLALIFATSTIPIVVVLFSATGILMAGKARLRGWSLGTHWAAAFAAALLALAAMSISTTTIAADAMMLQAKRSSNGAALARRAATLAPWYPAAREKAAFDYADAVVAAVEAGKHTVAVATAATDAESGLRALIVSNPQEHKYYVHLASYLDNVGSVLGADAFTRASTAADVALEIYPVSAEAAYLKGVAQLDLGDPSAAVKALAPLWDIDPAYPNAGVVYAEALLRSGDLARAERVVRTLTKRFPTNQDVRGVAARVTAAAKK